MKFTPTLVQGTLIKRYKRFLADVTLANGEEITAHCPNTGRMTGCADPGLTVWLRDSQNPKRKHLFTWELVESDSGLCCIHSALANNLVGEALENGVISELAEYTDIKSEVKFGEEKSRVDFLLSHEEQQCFVEVKCVTLHAGDGLGLFPDAVSSRGAKHLRELAAMVQQGHRAVLLFVSHHNGVDRVSPADEIDPVYGETLREAMEQGVEVLVYQAKMSTTEAIITQRLPFVLNNT